MNNEFDGQYFGAECEACFDTYHLSIENKHRACRMWRARFSIRCNRAKFGSRQSDAMSLSCLGWGLTGCRLYIPDRCTPCPNAKGNNFSHCAFQRWQHVFQSEHHEAEVYLLRKMECNSDVPSVTHDGNAALGGLQAPSAQVCRRARCAYG